MPENDRPTSWGDLLTKTVELGVGALHLTRETGSRLIDELEERGQLTKQQATEFVDRMREVGREQQHHIEGMINRAVERALDRADVARRSEIDALKERIAALEAEKATDTAPPAE
jgi:polyhydroxyalkanoate synthesis regulator phasin